jgi:hypothetical protein
LGQATWLNINESLNKERQVYIRDLQEIVFGQRQHKVLNSEKVRHAL